MKRHKLAGVTVLYHPSDDLERRIMSYASHLDVLYVVDNSEESARAKLGIFASDAKVIYMQNPENLGIARALNTGAHLALRAGCDYLLTMDQDSFFEGNSFEKLIESLNRIESETTGILSPVHAHPKAKHLVSLNEFEEVSLVMTSGNLLNLRIFQKAGDFLELLFIDHVDHEYCLRLRSLGYKIIITTRILLNHSLGSVKEIAKNGRLKFVSHSPLRTYYMIRNGLYVASMYKSLFRSFYVQNIMLTLKEFLKVFFEPQKLERLQLIILALRHYKTETMGKLADRHISNR